MRQVLLTPGEDGGWVIEVPSLPGCVSQADSRQEAIDMAREAITMYEEALRSHGEPIPPDDLDAQLLVI